MENTFSSSCGVGQDTVRMGQDLALANTQIQVFPGCQQKALTGLSIYLCSTSLVKNHSVQGKPSRMCPINDTLKHRSFTFHETCPKTSLKDRNYKKLAPF